MKFIISENLDSANAHVHKIVQHLQLSGKTESIYTVPQQIESADHPDNGKYIVKIITTGDLKCDDIFPSQDLVEYDSTWFPGPSSSEIPVQETILDIEE